MFDLTRLDLPAIVSAFLAAEGATRQGTHGDPDATSQLLAAHGFPAHPAVLSFEEHFGGLELHEPHYDVATLVVGPYACFSASPWTAPERDLVPVIYAVNDAVYFLDAEGRGWTCNVMAGGASRPCAENGHGLFLQAVLWRILESLGIEARQGREGADLAASKELPALSRACGETERWWGNADALVVEIDHGNGFTSPMTFAST